MKALKGADKWKVRCIPLSRNSGGPILNALTLDSRHSKSPLRSPRSALFEVQGYCNRSWAAALRQVSRAAMAAQASKRMHTRSPIADLGLGAWA